MISPPRKMNAGERLTWANYNALLDYVRRITPIQGANVTVDYRLGGAVISGTPGGGEADRSLKPWTVRKHYTADDANGQWEIWLPPGCMSVGGTLTPINKPASEASGHDDDRPGWYVLKLDESEGSATTETVGSGDSQVVTAARTWEIVAHAKTSAKMTGVDALDAPARRLLYVSARRQLTVAEISGQTAAQRVAGTWGDEFSQVVAIVTIGTRTAHGSSTQFIEIMQMATAPISAQGRPAGAFDLVWYFEFDQNGTLSVSDVYCLRSIASAAGITLHGPAMTKVTGANEYLYAKIKTNPLDPDGDSGSIEVVLDPQGMSADNYLTWLILYQMSSNAVVADYRSQSLVNLQVYR